MRDARCFFDLLLTVTAACGLSATARAAVTFNRDIAPIIYQTARGVIVRANRRLSRY
jgi:hypothetical protein